MLHSMYTNLNAGIVVVNIQTNVSWGVGIGIPLASFCIAFAAFLAGSRKYRQAAAAKIDYGLMRVFPFSNYHGLL